MVLNIRHMKKMMKIDHRNFKFLGVCFIHFSLSATVSPNEKLYKFLKCRFFDLMGCSDAPTTTKIF